jgi:hypothetical protein
MLPTATLADIVDDTCVIATMLNERVPHNPAKDIATLRCTIASLAAAADNAALAAAEHGDNRAVHHAFGCAKELAVLKLQVDTLQQNRSD